MLRLLHVLAIAIFTLIGVGAATEAPAYAAVGHVSDAVRATRSISAPLAPHQEWRRSMERPVDDPGSLEANLDDDDDFDGRDAHVGRTDTTVLAFDETWFGPKAARPFRSESSIDPSRHAVRSAFPRGPPSSRA